mmetsp:Transcript_2869/g.5902  ORF Transcript_2869/g.5902 Transcript_2869/m.5902 type:complete len:751 (-) Transcript_2869:152-2404(-)
MDNHGQEVLPNDISGIMTISSSVQRCIKNGRDPIIQQRAKAIISMKLMTGYCLKGNSHVCTRCLMPLMVKRRSPFHEVEKSDGEFPDSKEGAILGKGVCVVCPEIYKIKEQDNEVFERMFVRHAGIHAKNSLVSNGESECSGYGESEVDSARAEEESYDDDSSYDSEEYGEDDEFDYDSKASHITKYPRCEACGMDITDGDPNGNKKCHFCVVANGMHSVYLSQSSPYFAFENSIIHYDADPEHPRREEESLLRQEREDEIFQREIQKIAEKVEMPEQFETFQGESEKTASVEDDAMQDGIFEREMEQTAEERVEDDTFEREVEKGATTKKVPVHFEIDSEKQGIEVEICPKEVEASAASAENIATDIPAEVIIDTNAKAIKANLKETKDKSEISAEEVLTKLIAKFWLRNGKSIKAPKKNKLSEKPMGPDTAKFTEKNTSDDRAKESEDIYSALRSCKVSEKAVDSFRLIFDPSEVSLSSDESTIELVLHDKTVEKWNGRVKWKDHAPIEAEASKCHREDPPMGNRGMDPPSTCGEDDGSVSLESRNNPSTNRPVTARDPSPTRELEEKMVFPESDDEIRQQLMVMESKFREEDVMGSDGTLTNMLIRGAGSGLKGSFEDDRTDMVSSMGSVTVFEQPNLSKVSSNHNFLYEKEVIQEEEVEEESVRDRNISHNKEVMKENAEEEWAWNDRDCNVSRGEEFYYAVKSCDSSIAAARNELSPSALARRRHYKEMLLRQRRAQSAKMIAQE